MFETDDMGQRIQKKYIKKDKINDLYLDYEYHQLLDVDYRGVPCKKENAYKKDLCTAKMIEKELINNVGCTTPYEPDKSQICKQKDNAVQAIELAKSMIDFPVSRHWRNEKTNTCVNPCSIFSFTTTNIEKHVDLLSKGTGVYIHFPKNIKVFERSYAYSKLSLLAEIGGYVGLFLGISINQVINLLDYLVSKLEWIYQCSNL